MIKSFAELGACTFIVKHLYMNAMSKIFRLTMLFSDNLL